MGSKSISEEFKHLVSTSILNSKFRKTFKNFCDVSLHEKSEKHFNRSNPLFTFFINVSTLILDILPFLRISWVLLFYKNCLLIFSKFLPGTSLLNLNARCPTKGLTYLNRPAVFRCKFIKVCVNFSCLFTRNYRVNKLQG